MKFGFDIFDFICRVILPLLLFVSIVVFCISYLKSPDGQAKLAEVRAERESAK